jgi:glutamine cyclotransferase
LAAFLACSCSDGDAGDGVPSYTYRIVNSYPHDSAAWTQGLLYHDGYLYEGTGLYGRSSIRRVELETGRVLHRRDLSDAYFGEGIALYEGRLVQITWLERVGFVYDRETFEPMDEFNYASQGWGLTSDGKRLIMSDGSARLYFLNPDTYEEIGRVVVRDGKAPISNLNELEYVDGYVYANVHKTDRIARIDPASGLVTGWVNLKGLLDGVPPGNEPPNYLNGIAFDAEERRLFVTGKFWPRVFEIELVPEE